MRIRVIPIDDVSQDVLENIPNRLMEVYSPILEKVELESQLKLPSQAYDPNRNQYKAGIILQYISSKAPLPRDGKALAITSKDLFSQGLNFVFGQAQKAGKIAIISLHRLKPEFWGEEKDRNLFLNRAAKEAIHELGHTFGLNHCDKRSCVMTFSNSIKETDRKGPEFCRNCRDKIEARRS